MPEKNDIPIFRNLDGVTTAWFVMVYMSTDAFLICPKPSRM